MKYLKKFDTNDDYWNYVVSDNFISPNVSRIKDETSSEPLHFNNYCLKVGYEVASAGTATKIIFNPSFKGYIADGTYHELKVPTYTFENTGSNEVIFFFKKGQEYLLGDSDFSSCPALTSMTVPSFVTEIRYGLLAMTGIKSFVVPSNVKTMCTRLSGKTGEGLTFYNCSGLTDLTIETGGVTVLPTAMCYNNFALKNVNLGDSIEAIHDYCFSMYSGINTDLTSLRFGKNLKSMGSSLFRYCTGLKELIMDCEQIPTITSSTFQSTYFGGFDDPEDESQWAKIYVPDDMYDAYLADSSWSAESKYLKKMSERPTEE